MSLFGATTTFKKAVARARVAEEKMAKEGSSAQSTTTSAVSSSHIGDILDRHNEMTGPLPTDPDGTATTSEIGREELGDYLGLGEQPAAVTLTREQYNHGVRIHNAEVMAEGHLSQIIEPIWRENSVIDEYGNRRGHAVHTISSDDDSSLSPPPTTNYG